MENIESEMKKIRSKKSPNVLELQKYVRYLVNARKYDADSVYEDVPDWNRSEIEKALKEIERENSKPKPQRYYVSLKEPLDEER
jgi:hypothetical protein